MSEALARASICNLTIKSSNGRAGHSDTPLETFRDRKRENPHTAPFCCGGHFSGGPPPLLTFFESLPPLPCLSVRFYYKILIIKGNTVDAPLSDPCLTPSDPNPGPQSDISPLTGLNPPHMGYSGKICLLRYNITKTVGNRGSAHPPVAHRGGGRTRATPTTRGTVPFPAPRCTGTGPTPRGPRCTAPRAQVRPRPDISSTQ